MGAGVRAVNRNTMEIDSSGLTFGDGPYELMRRIRASSYLIGAMLGRFGRAKVAMPGGCDFGVRPIDQHIKGFTAMGAETEISGGLICAQARDGLHGANVYLDIVSVGATMNIMMAAVLAKGRTVIENAAREPHIVDLANFLNSMGADVRGAGTNVIRIYGVQKLRGGTYSIIPDQIEAGTFIAAVAGAGGEVLIKNVIPKHLECITAKLEEMGVYIEARGDSVLVKREKPLRRTNIKTMPYPGFPTDMQPQITALLSIARGSSVVTEDVWDNRFKYVDELKRMGARIKVDGRTALVEGIDKLSGAPVKACDLRAGAAMVIAGLCACGVTVVEDIHHIERGYENLVGKLRGLGADILEVSETDPEDGDIKQVVG